MTTTAAVLTAAEREHVAYLRFCAELMDFETRRPRIDFAAEAGDASAGRQDLVPAMAPRYERIFAYGCTNLWHLRRRNGGK